MGEQELEMSAAAAAEAEAEPEMAPEPFPEGSKVRVLKREWDEENDAGQEEEFLFDGKAVDVLVVDRDMRQCIVSAGSKGKPGIERHSYARLRPAAASAQRIPGAAANLEKNLALGEKRVRKDRAREAKTMRALLPQVLMQTRREWLLSTPLSATPNGNAMTEAERAAFWAAGPTASHSKRDRQRASAAAARADEGDDEDETMDIDMAHDDDDDSDDNDDDDNSMDNEDGDNDEDDGDDDDGGSGNGAFVAEINVHAAEGDSTRGDDDVAMSDGDDDGTGSGNADGGGAARGASSVASRDASVISDHPESIGDDDDDDDDDDRVAAESPPSWFTPEMQEEHRRALELRRQEEADAKLAEALAQTFKDADASSAAGPATGAKSRKGRRRATAASTQPESGAAGKRPLRARRGKAPAKENSR